MEAQLRVYTVKPGGWAEWVEEWREHVLPLRERFGFRVLGPWGDEETRTFAWVVEYDGPEGYEEANRRYYESPERQGLDPDPARHLETVETQLLRRL